MDDARIRMLFDRAEIEETALRMGQAADQGEWEALISCFTDEIELDYTSLAGGDPERVGARELVLERWTPVLGNLDATQHFTGPCTVRVDGDRAEANAYFQAQHVLASATGGEKWTLGGRYDWEFVRTHEGWKISGVTMTAIWDDGNRELMAQVADRSRQTEGRA